jgi:hypothetical protein
VWLGCAATAHHESQAPGHTGAMPHETAGGASRAADRRRPEEPDPIAIVKRRLARAVGVKKLWRLALRGIGSKGSGRYRV